MFGLKHCSKCGCEKPADNKHWYFKRGKPNTPCKACQCQQKREFYHTNKTLVQDKQRKWRESNKEGLRSKNAKYYNENTEVVKEQQRKWRESNKEGLRQKNLNYYRKKREELCEKARLLRRSDPEMVRQRDKRRRDKNIEIVREKQRTYYKQRYLTDAKYRLNQCVSSAVRRSLKQRGSTKTQRKLHLLDWSIDDLLRHLKPLFEEGMTLENHGEWEIDHIIPLSAVNYESEKDPLFKMVWSLSNLAPLWAKDNNSKLASLEWQLPDTYKNPKLRALYEDRDYLMTIF